MGDLTRGERLQIMLSPEELKIVDDWRFANRMPSRAAAIRELLRLGMKHNGLDVTESGHKSANYGIVDGRGNRLGSNGRDGDGEASP